MQHLHRAIQHASLTAEYPSNLINLVLPRSILKLSASKNQRDCPSMFCSVASPVLPHHSWDSLRSQAAPRSSSVCTAFSASWPGISDESASRNNRRPDSPSTTVPETLAMQQSTATHSPKATTAAACAALCTLPGVCRPPRCFSTSTVATRGPCIHPVCDTSRYGTSCSNAQVRQDA